MRALLIGACALAAAGCVIEELDYTGKACPCPDGYTCREPENVCSRSSNVPTGQPVDWTNALRVVWLFESASPDLGVGSDDTLNLSERGQTVGRNTDELRQGSSSLDLVDGRLDSTHPAFSPTGLDGFTLGGWVRTTVQDEGVAVAGRYSNGFEGYSIQRTMAGNAECAVGQSYGKTPTGSWRVDDWEHVVCRWQDDVAVVFQSGRLAEGNPDPSPISEGDNTFKIGNDASSNRTFVGQVDEFFFHDAPLSNAAIERIRVCGIDGRDCTCNASDPTQYDSCGVLGDACSTLPACDADVPL